MLAAPQAVLPAGWRVENGTDLSILDYTAVESPITVSGLIGMAPKDWNVSVELKHTYRGDLTLDLVAPDGTAYLLEDFTGGGDADDVAKTYTVNASSELADGVWKLRVRDRVWGDVGHIDSWSLAAAPTGTPAPAVAWPEVSGSAIKIDSTSVGATGESSVRVAGVSGNAPAELRVETLHLVHVAERVADRADRTGRHDVRGARSGVDGVRDLRRGHLVRGGERCVEVVGAAEQFLLLGDDQFVEPVVVGEPAGDATRTDDQVRQRQRRRDHRRRVAGRERGVRLGDTGQRTGGHEGRGGHQAPEPG